MEKLLCLLSFALWFLVGPRDVANGQEKDEPPRTSPSSLESRTFVGTHKGIAAIDASGWSVIDEAKGLPSARIKALAADGAGNLWVAHSRGISRYGDGQWKHYPMDVFGYGTIDTLHCDARGRVWGGYYKGLYVLENDEWVFVGGEEIGVGANTAVKDITEDAAGVVWIATTAGVSSFDGAGWECYDESSGLASRFTEAVAADPTGRIWVGHSLGVSVFDGQEWINYGSGGARIDEKISNLSQVKGIDCDRDGTLWAITWARGILSFDGGSWEVFDRSNSGLIGGNGTAIRCDPSGRVWAATDWEMAVYEGGRWLTYTQATSGLPSNGMSDIAVTGNGSHSLPQPGQAFPGSVSGRIVSGSAGLSGVRVNLCWDVSWPVFFGSTPCKGKVYEAIADDTGGFLIAGVPIGCYEMAISVTAQPKTKWYAGGGIAGLPKSFHVISGQETKLGNLEIEP